MADATLAIKIVADASQAAAELDKAAGSGGRFGNAMRKAAAPAAAAVTALAAVGAKAVKSASDLQQSEGAVSAVYGKQASAVEEYADRAATAMGLSAAEYNNYAALVGTSLQEAGMSSKQAVEESNKIMQRAADLSALYGGSTADAVDAINAAVSRGEFDPLEKYGIALNATAVNAELAKRGQDDLTGAQLDAAKKAIILEQVYSKSAKAAGQYARESDSVAGVTQTMGAQWENAAAALGTALLPVVSVAVGYLSEFAAFAQENTTLIQVLAGVVGGLALAILAVNAAMAAYSAISTIVTGVTKAWSAVQAVLNAVMAMNPILLVVIAVVALIAVLIIAYKKSETFRRIVDAMWKGLKTGALAAWQAVKVAFDAIWAAAKVAFEWIKSNWRLLAAILLGPFGIALGLITKHWGKIKAGAKAAAKVIKAVWNTIKSSVRAVGVAIRAAFTKAFDAVKSAVRSVGAVIKSILRGVRAVAGEIARGVKDAWNSAWRTIKETVRAQIQLIKAAIQGVKAVVTTVVNYIKEKFQPVWGTVRAAAKTAMDLIVGPINTVKAAIGKLITTVQSLIEWLGKIKIPDVGGAIDKLNPFSAAASAPAPTLSARSRAYVAAPSVRAGGVGTMAAYPGMTVINVNGALDPEAVARQIKRIVGGHERRIGLRVGG